MHFTPDVIVLGTGGVGSAALWHLASRGLRVTGLDQHPPAHACGSSHGQSRIIRKAYFEHPDYVPLLERAYELWDDLRERSGRPDLFERCGLLQVGPPDGAIIPGVLESARRHRLAVETLTAGEVAKAFPQYRIPPGDTAVFEQDAGFLRVEDCVLACLDAAQAAGAALHTGVTVYDWRAEGDGVEVRTSEGTFHAGALVITGGAWAPQLLGDLGVPMIVRRKPLFWLQARSGRHRLDAGCPCFFYDRPGGQFYGFPELSTGDGVKIACHTGGDPVADPALVDRSLDEIDLAKVRDFALQWFPEVEGTLRREKTCLYTMSPDEHFIIDRHPRHRRVVFAAGLSGHGYKFASVLGEILSDLLVDGESSLPVDFLGLARFA
jgi:sarcosine oxidase